MSLVVPPIVVVEKTLSWMMVAKRCCSFVFLRIPFVGADAVRRDEKTFTVEYHSLLLIF